MHGKKLTLQDAQKLAESKGGQCLSTEYVSSKTKMLWKCNKCKYQWQATYHNIRKNHWCPYCVDKAKHTLQDAQDLAEKKKGKCLSIKYTNNNTKMLWECEFEHQWEATYHNIKQDHWCPKCNTNKTQKN